MNRPKRTDSRLALLPELEKVKNNQIHEREWKRTAILGSGGFGSVFVGQRVDDGMVFAVKSTPLPSIKDSKILSRTDALQNEMKVLMKFRCKNIVRMLGCGRSDGTNSFRPKEIPMLDLFLEYVPRGSLHNLMRRLDMGATEAKTDMNADQTDPKTYSQVNENSKRQLRLPEAYVRAYATDILTAVDYLHKKQYVHGDIKPMNMLLSDDCLKLADFGGCKTLKEKRANIIQIHTKKYDAPEVVFKLEQGFASDIYSVGVSVLEMTCGNVPEPVFIPQWLSKDGQSFLRRSLATDLTKRWTAGQLLQHPFIRDRDPNDKRPYSTAIPPDTERMILTPTPIDVYTNNPISPTYKPPFSFSMFKIVPPITFQALSQAISTATKSFRTEQIDISSPPPQPTALVLPATSSPSAIGPKSGSPSNRQIANSSVDGGENVVPKLDQTITLPACKPEISPPIDNSINFLLAPADRHLLDIDGVAPKRGLEQKRPPPLTIPSDTAPRHSFGSHPKPKPPDILNALQYETLLLQSLSKMGSKNIEDLRKSLVVMEECNRSIREEAVKAEEAGVCVDRLSPKPVVCVIEKNPFSEIALRTGQGMGTVTAIATEENPGTGTCRIAEEKQGTGTGHVTGEIPRTGTGTDHVTGVNPRTGTRPDHVTGEPENVGNPFSRNRTEATD